MTRTLAQASRSFARIALVTTLMVGPVYAMTVMNDGIPASGMKGAGLVLVVNIERNR